MSKRLTNSMQILRHPLRCATSNSGATANSIQPLVTALRARASQTLFSFLGIHYAATSIPVSISKAIWVALNSQTSCGLHSCRSKRTTVMLSPLNYTLFTGKRYSSNDAMAGPNDSQRVASVAYTGIEASRIVKPSLEIVTPIPAPVS